MTTWDQRKYLKLEGPHSDAQEALIKLSKRKKACKTQNGEQQEEIWFLKIGVDGTEGEEQGGWEKNYLWHKWEMREERRLKLSRVRLRAHENAWCQCKYTSVFWQTPVDW